MTMQCFHGRIDASTESTRETITTLQKQISRSVLYQNKSAPVPYPTKNQPDTETMAGQRHDDAHPNPLEGGQQSAHNIKDPLDTYSLADRANKEKKEEKEEDERKASQQDVPPTAAAREHGNKPSRGAVMDEQLQKEDEERLRQMDESKKAKSHQ
ncbi:hypothetical protein GGTG_02509 [Gaeumannomyces tritici R3-111a-1]|uniref:Uncharacterized protein n=1 Tax=Gaeumannomyces tritici (strain R3-111a-1) TaxID=644352 RepID=J3NMK3_GAET3|nr:hypothetical protein GGTG_02509 [Gaeumannomyces tritici R3-111a-1]EJT82536.1 hypothetical protein GGTG_02509 [Gaeumannomyces tritici R3-111a-1]